VKKDMIDGNVTFIVNGNYCWESKIEIIGNIGKLSGNLKKYKNNHFFQNFEILKQHHIKQTHCYINMKRKPIYKMYKC
jgi:hypothetical protein